jgi:hypothetical protein
MCLAAPEMTATANRFINVLHRMDRISNMIPLPSHPVVDNQMALLEDAG